MQVSLSWPQEEAGYGSFEIQGLTQKTTQISVCPAIWLASIQSRQILHVYQPHGRRQCEESLAIHILAHQPARGRGSKHYLESAPQEIHCMGLKESCVAAEKSDKADASQPQCWSTVTSSMYNEHAGLQAFYQDSNFLSHFWDAKNSV